MSGTGGVLKMKKILHKSRGQVLVLYTIALTGLLAAVALGTDVTMMYMDWQQAQKVADAAALAGANYRAGIAYTGTPVMGCSGENPSDSATVAACTYAVNNGLAASTVTISEPSATTIKVVAAQSSPYAFAKAFGMGNYSVSASATANSPGPVDTVSKGLLPLGLQCTAPCPAGSLVAGEPVSFGNKFISSTINLPGNWDWLALDGGGGSTLRTDIANGASKSFSVGDIVNTKPGGTNGPVKQGIDDRFAGCPSIPDPCANGGNPNNIPAGDPCLVIVPVVDFAQAAKAGKTSMPILAFAEVYLDPNTTDRSHINGCYVSSVVGDTLTGGTPSFGPTTPPVLIN